ncbi:hypothetical protein EBZ37_15025, partial [bacterium]|nr:hypothetical protein [bacterium]
FVVHFLTDELHLLSTPEKSVPLPVQILFFWLFVPYFTRIVVESALSIPLYWPTFWTISAALLISSFACLFRSKAKDYSSSVYFLSISGVSLLGIALDLKPYIANQLNFIILLHFWIGYAHPLWNSNWEPRKKKRFLIELGVCNSIFFATALLYYLEHSIFLGLIFSRDAFLLSTCLHYIATARWLPFFEPTRS